MKKINGIFLFFIFLTTLSCSSSGDYITLEDYIANNVDGTTKGKGALQFRSNTYNIFKVSYAENENILQIESAKDEDRLNIYFTEFDQMEDGTYPVLDVDYARYEPKGKDTEQMDLVSGNFTLSQVTKDSLVLSFNIVNRNQEAIIGNYTGSYE